MTLIPERLAELDSIQLQPGSHQPDHTFCFMEFLAYAAGEPWGDQPSCASRVLGAFIRPLQDYMDYLERQRLKPYIARVFGTVGTKEQEQQRAFMLADWAIHFAAPLALRSDGLETQAVELESLPPILDSLSALDAQHGARHIKFSSPSAAAGLMTNVDYCVNDARVGYQSCAGFAADVARSAMNASTSVTIASVLDLLDRLIQVTES